MHRAGRSRTTIWPVHTALRIDRIDTITVEQLRCTSASRTILDLARAVTKAELARAIDSAVRDGSSSPTFLQRRLADRRGPGHWGVTLVDELQALGYTVLEFTYADIHDRPGYVIALLRRYGL
jgi:hypothetical protein